MWVLVLLLSHAYEDSCLAPQGTWSQVSKELHRIIEPLHCPVLVAFDLDNTVMASKSDLGSDAWFDWQVDLLNHSPKSPKLVSKDFKEIILTQELLHNFMPMALTEAGVALELSKLQEARIPVIGLTARSPTNAQNTLRILRELGVQFSTAPTMGAGQFYKPFDSNTGPRWGIPRKHYSRFKFNDPPRVALYEGGVLFSDGQHKGVVLRNFLERSGLNPCLVAFVDDKGKHVMRVNEAMEGLKGTKVAAFRYDGERARVHNFLSDPKLQEQAHGDFQKFRAAIQQGDLNKARKVLELQ